MSDSFVGDASRQATAPIAGYVYQLWWSLYSWCVLQPRENLYLEHAEDFDVVGPQGAAVVQVKNSARVLTLASPDALGAIANWWGHRQRNPHHSVKLRFLTRATSGLERGRPFRDEHGLVYWDRAKRVGVPLDPLRAFLLVRDELPSSLRDFIREVGDERLRQGVVGRISWDLGNPSQQDVRALAERELAEICVPNYGIYVEEAQALAPRLWTCPDLVDT